MLTESEKGFMKYWEENRDSQKKTSRQFLLGIPIALVFVVPIAVNFFSGWYKRANMERLSGEFNPVVLLVALLAIVCFIAIFSKKFQWEKNEQIYLELKAKLDKENEYSEKK